MVDPTSNRQVDDFIAEAIDSVPHLEALLLLWNSKPRTWSRAEMGRALYLSENNAEKVLLDLKRNGLAESLDDTFFSYASGERDQLIEAVEKIYRREIVRISRMIHSKAPASVREFAKAFRFKKDKE
jgi:hypothetical protein